MNVDINKFNKRVTLITNVSHDTEITENKVVVWASKKSVTRSEFYMSYQSALAPQLVFQLRLSAYKLSQVTDLDGSKRYAGNLVYDGTTYNIIRTYEDGEFVELVCG